MKFFTREDQTRSLTDEELLEFRKIAGGLALLAVIFMGSLVLLVHNDVFKLHPASSSPETLGTFGEKAEFAFRYQSLLALWLLFNIFMTIYGRYLHMAVNPLDTKTEEHVQIYKNILTNSYEQILLSVLSQLVFISFASPLAIVRYIPLLNIFMFVGRVTFFAGYPFYRTFGFLTSVLPTFVLVFYNIFKFGSFIGIY